MDLDQIKYLPDDMKERYAKMERMFDSAGWALVEEHLKARINEVQQRQLSSTTWDSALVNRGASLAFAEILTLREGIEKEFEAVAAQNREQAQLHDELENE